MREVVCVWCVRLGLLLLVAGTTIAQRPLGQPLGAGTIVPSASSFPNLSGVPQNPSVASFNRSPGFTSAPNFPGIVEDPSLSHVVTFNQGGNVPGGANFPSGVNFSQGPTFNQHGPSFNNVASFNRVGPAGQSGTSQSLLPNDPSNSTSRVPIGRVIVEGYWFSRTGVGGDHPLILDDVSPLGEALVTSDDLRLKGEVGGQLHLELGGFYTSYLESGRAETRLESQSNPADINWFDASALEPDDRYFTIYDSYLKLWDIGIRRQPRVGTDVYVGFGMGRFEEHMDHLSQLDPPRGFYAYARNEFYGAHLGVRHQLFVGGNCRVEATARGGLYFNSIEVNATAFELDEFWDDDSVAYSGLGNISLVIPAWPVNFRIGYQLMLLGGVVTPQEASRTLDSFNVAAGEIETSEVLYHGLTFGVEKLW